MPADRLQELLRQRALVEEHLAWLDREIEAASGRPASLPSPTATRPAPAPQPVAKAAPAAPAAAQGYLASQAAAITQHAAAARAAAAPAATDENPAVVHAAETILEEYRVAPDALKTDVRKGCFLYLLAAFALLALGVTALYFLIGRH